METNRKYETGIRTVLKPWGKEVLICCNERYAIKYLYIDAGKRLSKQYHKVKDEVMYPIEGSVEIELNNNIIQSDLYDGFIHIPPMTVHRVYAHKDSMILEISTPELDDVVRLEDDYGRL